MITSWVRIWWWVLNSPDLRPKNLRMGHGHLRGAYVTVKDGQLWLINATISGTGSMPISEQDQTRSRRLLAKHREIDALITAKQQGKTIIPLEMLTRGRFIKLRIAVARGKKNTTSVRL